MGFWDAAGETLFGTQTGAAGKAAVAAGSAGAGAAGQAAQGVGAQAQGMTNNALGQGQRYDQGTQQSMGANAADYLGKARADAEGAASKQAQQASTQGTQAALRASRSSGLNAGQAALASGQQAAGTYQNALAQGTQQGIQNYMGATGQFAGQGAEMAGRANAGVQNQLGAVSQQNAAAQTQAGIGNQQQANANQTAQNTWGTIGNIAGVVAPLIASDVNVKKNIEGILDKVMVGKPSPVDAILDKVYDKGQGGVTFDYNGEADGTDHLGVVAQDLEGSPLKNVVKDTPNGKAIDTGELSTANLNLIIELASRVRDLERKQ
jgi:hypothetical protein